MTRWENWVEVKMESLSICFLQKEDDVAFPWKVQADLGSFTMTCRTIFEVTYVM